MTTRNQFEINGLIDTDNNVFDNIELLASSAGSFLTWDPELGKWSIIVNQTASSVFSFNDSNIIGNITVGGTGINELYNSVQIEFPHKDLRDATDYVTVTLPSEDRFENELDNQLNISLKTINDPVQAQIIASIELKQNRLDKVIQFSSDFVANGIKAGDIISVTNTALSFSSKLFRAIQLSEEDTEDGSIVYSITALEYDANIYNVSGLEYEYRTKVNGIPSKITNDVMAVQDDIDIGSQIARLLAANAALGIINSLFTVDEETGAIINEGKFADPDTQALMESAGKKPNLTHAPASTEVCSGGTVSVGLSMPEECGNNCFFDIPSYQYDYTITGLTAPDSSIPLTGKITTSNGSATLAFTANVTEEKTAVISVGGNTSSIKIAPAPAWTVNISPSASSITEGGSVTFNITTTNISNGTNLPYTLTGITASRVSTPLSGNITINSNSGSLTVATINGSDYTGDEDMVLTLTMPTNDYCGVGGDTSSTVTVLDNEDAPVRNTVCGFTIIPVIYCPVYDGDDNLIDLEVQKTATVRLLSVGGIEVPSSVSVSGGSVVVDSTVNVDNALGQAGVDINVITSFDSVLGPSDPTITGTTVTVRGWIN